MDSNCVRGVKQKSAPVVAVSCCGGKSLPRRRQRQQRTRQVLYGTTLCVALCYLDLSSVRVYTLIRWQVSGTSQGSCNLAEHTAEGRQWCKMGGWGEVDFCIQLLLQGLVAPNRKLRHTNTSNNVSESRSTALGLPADQVSPA